MSDKNIYSSHFPWEQSETPNRFTRGRAQRTLRDALYVQPAGVDDYPWEISSTSFDHDLDSGVLTPYNDPLRFKRATSACEKLAKLVQDPEGHMERLDHGFAQLLEFNIINFEGNEDDVVKKTCHLLSRLPFEAPAYWEPGAATACDQLDERYFINRKGDHEVKRLRASHYLGQNVIRMALGTALWPGSRPPFISNPGGPRRHGCTSYWMDAPCVPDDPMLRQEAIAQTNHVFGTSRLTLVCDRDVMGIDARNLTVPLRESIVAALLFCDWNMRAWTLLEAIMGVRSMHLLCKDDRVIRFADVVEAVHAEGRVDLVNTLLSSHHLLPRSDAIKTVQATERERDETIIWSILSEQRSVCYSPEQFWSQTNGVRTGMLMSHVPRIESAKGLSWAPRRPGLPLQTVGRAQCPPNPGEGSTLGIISDDGLTADWMVFDFDQAGDIWACSRRYSASLWELLRFVWAGTVGNLLAGYFPLVNAIILADFRRKASYWPRAAFIPTEAKRLCTQYAAKLKVGVPHVAFIRPTRNTIEPLPYPYAGDSNRVLLALIISEDEVRWTWPFPSELRGCLLTRTTSL